MRLVSRSLVPLLLWTILPSCGRGEVELDGPLVGRCSYVSPFTDGPECRDYLGAWSIEEAEADCAALEADFEAGLGCETADALGYCLLDDGDTDLRVTVEDDGQGGCGNSKLGCQVFGGGRWEDGARCGGRGVEIAVLDDPFPQPVLVCKDPLPGEPIGQSPGGQVCTWQMISGATEEDRAFSDYADCAPVLRQRPYSPAPPDERALQDDPRMADPAYVAELDWVRGQMRSAACECCHSSLAPDGPAVFDLDSEGSLADQFHDLGLAMGAGWVPTIGFGSYPPEENNGFIRSNPEEPYLSIFPSTDPERMIAFFERELERRGLTEEDFEGMTYGAGPLDAQRVFEPGRCSEEEGVDPDGRMRWLPGLARYIYVLQADAATPTVPPNLDLPEGTLWRLDVPEEGTPVASETITYGVVPQGLSQRFPEEGAPEPLVSGRDYYLYVAADVAYPISRCLFTAGEPPRGCGCACAPERLAGLPAAAALLALLGRRRLLRG